MDEHGWPSEWLRGVLGLCVLRVVAAGPTYGYAISVALADAGLGQLKGGTLYPLLSRFEAQGLIRAEWRPGEQGPGRKYYLLTAQGRAALADGATQWTAFAALTSALVTGHGTAPGLPGTAPGGPLGTAPCAPAGRTDEGSTP